MRSALKHLKKDPVMGKIIATHRPVRMQYREPTFETLVKSIVYQQLSGRVASVIFARLHAAAGEETLTPAGVMKLRPERMRKLGLSGQKTHYIRELAKHTRRRVRWSSRPCRSWRTPGNRAPDQSERHRRLDRADVPDVRAYAARMCCRWGIWEFGWRFSGRGI
jgi:endonuclease III